MAERSFDFQSVDQVACIGYDFVKLDSLYHYLLLEERKGMNPDSKIVHGEQRIARLANCLGLTDGQVERK